VRDSGERLHRVGHDRHVRHAPDLHRLERRRWGKRIVHLRFEPVHRGWYGLPGHPDVGYLRQGRERLLLRRLDFPVHHPHVLFRNGTERRVLAHMYQ
jgi:hypothetical protein